MRDFMDVIKALADENRVRALMALQGRELCVCQIIELLGLAPSTVSKHMAILRQAHLVEARKEGRWMYYRLADQRVDGPVRGILNWLERSLAETSQIAEDRRKLKEILDIDPEHLCRKQNRN